MNLDNNMIIELFKTAGFKFRQNDIYKTNQNTNLLCLAMNKRYIGKIDVLDKRTNHPIYNVFVAKYDDKDCNLRYVPTKKSIIRSDIDIGCLLQYIDPTEQVFSDNYTFIYKSQYYNDRVICIGIGEIAIIKLKQLSQNYYQIKRFKTNDLEDINENGIDNINTYYRIENNKMIPVSNEKYDL